MEKSEIGKKFVNSLSQPGYYVIVENGKLIRKRQEFFASKSNRDLLKNEISPGPGEYNLDLNLNPKKGISKQLRKDSQKTRKTNYQDPLSKVYLLRNFLA